MRTRAERLSRAVRKLAAAAAATTLVVITVSALLRLANAGLGCEPWPQCYGVPRVAPWLEAVRATHRVSALLVALLVLGAFMLAASAGRAAARLAALAGAALAMTVFLTGVGIITPGSRLPAVVLANLVGGMALFTLLWWLSLAAGSTGATPAGRIDRVAMIAIVLVFAQIALGGFAHATFGSTSCPTLSGCAAAEWLPQVTASAFDPFSPVGVADGRTVPREGAAAVHMMHRALAVVVVVWLAWVASRAWRAASARASAIALATALAMQFVTGVLLVMLEMPLAATVAHNVAASLLLAALVQVTFRLRALS